MRKTKEPKKCFLLKPVPIVTNCKSSENWNKTFIRGRSRHSNVLKRFQSISWIRCRAMATSNSYLSHASQRILIHEGSLSLVIASKNATKFPTVSVYWRPKEAITCTSSQRIGNTTQIQSFSLGCLSKAIYERRTSTWSKVFPFWYPLTLLSLYC